MRKMIFGLALCAGLIGPATAHAFVKNIGGFVADLTGVNSVINRAGDRLDRSASRISKLANEFRSNLDQNVADRIEQAGEEARETIVALNAAVEARTDQVDAALEARIEQLARHANALVRDLNALERQIMADVVCVAEQIGDRLERSVIDALRHAAEIEIEVDSPFLTNAMTHGETVNPRIFEIQVVADRLEPLDPDEKFRLLEQQTLLRLRAATPATSSRLLVYLYSELARSAMLTSCHYRELALKRELMYSYRRYSAAADRWSWARFPE